MLYPYINKLTGTVHKTRYNAILDATYDLLKGYITREDVPDGNINNLIIDLREEEFPECLSH